MKYILELIDKDPANNMTIKCDSSKEAIHYKKKGREMGFKVKIKGVKNEQNTPTVKEQ